MIESQILRQTFRIEHGHGRRIVLSMRNAAGFGHVYYRHRMPASVALRIGIHSQQRGESYLQGNFLTCLAHRGAFNLLPHIHKPSGNGPTRRRIAAFNQHNGSSRTIG